MWRMFFKLTLLLTPLFVLQTVWRLAAGEGTTVLNGTLNLPPAQVPEVAVSLIWWIAAVVIVSRTAYQPPRRKLPELIFIVCVSSLGLAWLLLGPLISLRDRLITNGTTGFLASAAMDLILISVATLQAASGVKLGEGFDGPPPAIARW